MATEVKEIELGTVQSMADYNKARDEGKSVIEIPIKAAEEIEEKPAETTEEKQEVTDDKPKGKGGFQKRIDKLIRENAEARERAEKAELRAKELEAKGGKAEPEKVAPKADARPVEDDFKTMGEYIEALTDWKLQQTLKAQSEAEEAEAEQET